MTRLPSTFPFAAFAAFSLLALTGPALAQDGRSSGNFLDNLFNRGEPAPQSRPVPQAQPQGRVAQTDPGDLSVRLDRMENAMRQLTGTIEQLQHQNQMLEMRLQRMQDDTEYRFQQLGAKGGAAPMRAPGNPPPQPGSDGQRSDVFNPAQHPDAPGVPRTLGNPQMIAAPAAPGDNAANEQPIGAPGGRDVGAPLDLSTLAGNAPAEPLPPAPVASAAPTNAGPQGAPMPPPQAGPMGAPQTGQLPPPPPRNPSALGVQLATLPPSATPNDEYQLAYGYVLHKDYGLAEQAFRDFMRKYPSEKLLPDAQYWLGESQFQQQRYRDAAESFLAVSTKFAHAAKAPEALLRLGQSLAALNQKEAACATLAEVGRKYPRASANVKRSVVAEQKRTHC